MLEIPWPCYLSDCISPHWEPSNPCVQFWTEANVSTNPRTLTFKQFEEYTAEISSILLSHLHSWSLETPLAPLVVIIWSPHILTSVAVHAVAKARLSFFPLSHNSISTISKVQQFVFAIIDLFESDPSESLPPGFSVYRCNRSTGVFAEYKWCLLLRDPSTSLLNLSSIDVCDSYSHLAYAITSSGSSGGPPKFAFISDACFTANICDLYSRFGHTRIGRGSVLLTAPLTFDPSLVQIYFALATGRCLVVPGPGLLCHPESLAFFCSAAHVDWLQCTPSLFMIQNRISRQKMLHTPGLNIVLGGESFPLSLYDCSEHVSANLYNIYGATEVSCWATLCKVGRRITGNNDGECWCNCEPPMPGLTPIGFPMFATNATFHPTEDKNELILSRGKAGFTVLLQTSTSISAMDYRNSVCGLRSPTPWSTGDLVLLGSCGKCLWFAGRKDRSKKRLGHQICLETLEATISKCKFNKIDVHHCRCYLGSVRSGVTLIAYVWFSCHRLHPTRHRLHRSILKHMRVRIVNFLEKVFGPDSTHWIPTKFVFYEGVPILSTHGKVYRFVSDSGGVRGAKFLSSFRSLMSEHGLSLSSNKNFFDLGGTSLTAVHLVEALVQRFCELSPWKQDLLAKLFSVDIAQFAKFVLSCRSRTSLRAHHKSAKSQDHLLRVQKRVCDNSEIPHWFEHAKIVTHGSIQQHSGSTISRRLHPCWKQPFGKCIDASATIFDSEVVSSPVVCVGSHSGQFSVMDLRTGAFVWSVNVNERIECSSAIGFYSSNPLLAVGTLSGNLHGIELCSGRRLWSFGVGGSVKAAPLFLKHRSLFVVGSHGRQVCALDPRSPSNPAWVNSFDGSPIVAPISSSILSDTADHIFVASLGGSVGCIDVRAPNRRIWFQSNLPPIFSRLTVCPESLSDQQVVATFVDSSVRSFSAKTGQHLWRFPRLCEQANVFKDPLFHAVQNNLMIAANNGLLFSVDALSGECRWKQSFTDNLVPGEPVSLNTPSKLCDATDHSEDTLVALGRADGYLFLCCYHPLHTVWTSGPMTVVNSTKLPGNCFSSPVLFSSRETNECFLVTGCRDDNLYCFSIVQD